MAIRRHMRRNAAVLMGKLAYLVVLVVGIVAAITIVSPSFTFGNLVTTLGITSVAVGFAAVLEIQSRATIVETKDGQHVVIPNSTLFTNPVVVRNTPPAAPQGPAVDRASPPT